MCSSSSPLVMVVVLLRSSFSRTATLFLASSMRLWSLVSPASVKEAGGSGGNPRILLVFRFLSLSSSSPCEPSLSTFPPIFVCVCVFFLYIFASRLRPPPRPHHPLYLNDSTRDRLKNTPEYPTDRSLRYPINRIPRETKPRLLSINLRRFQTLYIFSFSS